MKARPGELKAGWSKSERDIELAWGGDGASKADSHLLHGALSMRRYYPTLGGYGSEHSLADELKARGYDLSTLRFSIRKHADRMDHSTPEGTKP